MRNWFENATAIVFISLLAGIAIAQHGTNKKAESKSADAKFVIHIDFNAIKQTKIGAILFDVAKQKALEEIDRGGDREVALNRIKQTLGLDPFEDIQSITLSTDDLDEDSESAVAVVRLRKSAGNLEGLALNLPEYDTEEHEQHTIHSARMPQSKGNRKIFGTVHGEKDQDRTIVLSPELTAVKSKLNELDSAGEELYANEGASGKANSKLVEMRVLEIPMEKIGRGPQAAVAKIITSFTADLTCDDESIVATAMTTTQNEKQAEQLQQMSNGLMAMIDLAQSMEPNDKDLRQIREVVCNFESTVADNHVTLTLSLNSEKILQAISKEMGIDLTQAVEKERSLVEAKISQERKQLEQIKAELEKAKQEADTKLEEIKKQLEQIK